MIRFANTFEAVEFLAERIARGAQPEGVPLSQLERDVLYSSAIIPTGLDACSRFDQECDEAEYERKIARLIRNARNSTRSSNKSEADSWSAAITALANADYYVQVMVAATAAAKGRPPGDCYCNCCRSVALGLDRRPFWF